MERRSKMDISKYATGGKAFLKATEIQAVPNGVFFILSEGEFIVNKFNDERLHLFGEFSKEERTFDCSKTNAKTIADVLGIDTRTWVGAQLKLETYKTKTNDGRLVDAINVKEVIKPGVQVEEVVRDDPHSSNILTPNKDNQIKFFK